MASKLSGSSGEDADDGRREALRRRARQRNDAWLAELLGGFADAHLDAMGTVELDSFADLLAQPDADLRAWITGRRPPPEELGIPALEMVLDYRKARDEADGG